ncbi:hypothetical protein ABEB36_010701 [Hypothenemus hampei]|uniref:Uncharacterized protein n=1 Tax=Hypothenemus hampei TaxID=57062 RepID=A0ABD1ECW2_HYPHA
MIFCTERTFSEFSFITSGTALLDTFRHTNPLTLTGVALSCPWPSRGQCVWLYRISAGLARSRVRLSLTTVVSKDRSEGWLWWFLLCPAAA